jgi:lysylphosphatidylglycerol synthetase-like protein (DUF2156 family)
MVESRNDKESALHVPRSDPDTSKSSMSFLVLRAVLSARPRMWSIL